MRALLLAIARRWAPASPGETEQQWLARRYPHLVPAAFWTDGTF